MLLINPHPVWTLGNISQSYPHLIFEIPFCLWNSFWLLSTYFTLFLFLSKKKKNLPLCIIKFGSYGDFAFMPIIFHLFVLKHFNLLLGLLLLNLCWWYLYSYPSLNIIFWIFSFEKWASPIRCSITHLSFKNQKKK